MESSDDITNGKSTLPDAKLSILLIGSTGNGKSTLGNFLLDPSGKLERKTIQNSNFQFARNPGRTQCHDNAYRHTQLQ